MSEPIQNTNADELDVSDNSSSELSDEELQSAAGGNLADVLIAPSMRQLRDIAIKNAIKAVENFPPPKKE